MRKLYTICITVLVMFLTGCSGTSYENDYRPVNVEKDSKEVLITRLDKVMSYLNNDLHADSETVELYTNHTRDEIFQYGDYANPSYLGRNYWNVMLLDEVKHSLDECKYSEGKNYKCNSNSYFLLTNDNEVYIERQVKDISGFMLIEMLHIQLNANEQYQIDNYNIEINNKNHSEFSTTVFHLSYDKTIDYYTLTNDSKVFMSFDYQNNEEGYDYRYFFDSNNQPQKLNFFLSDENIYTTTNSESDNPRVTSINVYDQKNLVVIITLDDDGGYTDLLWNALFVDGWDKIVKEEDSPNRCDLVSTDNNEETIIDLGLPSNSFYCPRQDEIFFLPGKDITTENPTGLTQFGLSTTTQINQQVVDNYLVKISNEYATQLQEAKSYTLTDEQDILDELKSCYGVK